MADGAGCGPASKPRASSAAHGKRAFTAAALNCNPLRQGKTFLEAWPGRRSTGLPCWCLGALAESGRGSCQGCCLGSLPTGAGRPKLCRPLAWACREDLGWGSRRGLPRWPGPQVLWLIAPRCPSCPGWGWDPFPAVQVGDAQAANSVTGSGASGEPGRCHPGIGLRPFRSCAPVPPPAWHVGQAPRSALRLRPAAPGQPRGTGKAPSRCN